jgi:hypothetical protein
MKSCGSSRAMTSPAWTRSPTLTIRSVILPAARVFRLECDPLHLHRTLGPGDGGDCLILAGRKQRQQGEGSERTQR